MKVRNTFAHGGIHPPDSKRYSRDAPIRNAPVPARVVIPLHQHMGLPAECVVNPGDRVREGMLIGRAAGAFSASVHSSIPGVVREVGEMYLPTGVRSRTVVIELEGEFDHSGKGGHPRPWEDLPAAGLLQLIREKGIVGLGGAAFPTVLKYTVREGSRVQTFVVNGVECEPYLTADHRLMLEKTDEVLEGARIAQRILQPDRVIVAVEENKPDAIARMRERVSARGLGFEVIPLEVRYPQGDEKQLLQALLGREVPSGGLPLDIGAVVSNVGTVFAIYEAVALDKPLIDRVVTVSGSIVRQPSNLKVRLGASIGELIEECGGFTEPPARLLAGGPMMGFAMMGLDSPVTKGTSGVVALARRETRRPQETPCISCGRCLRACPLALRPTVIYKWVDHGEYDAALEEGLMDCKECGCCAYVCPAHIPLVQGMKLGKIMTRRRKKA